MTLTGLNDNVEVVAEPMEGGEDAKGLRNDGQSLQNWLRCNPLLQDGAGLTHAASAQIRAVVPVWFTRKRTYMRSTISIVAITPRLIPVRMQLGPPPPYAGYF